MRILWTRQASEQLALADDFLHRENSSAAENQLETILQAVDNLRRFPEIGRVGRIPNTRELVISGTPFVVAYNIRGEAVRILAVFHGARRWPTQL